MVKYFYWESIGNYIYDITHVPDTNEDSREEFHTNQKYLMKKDMKLFNILKCLLFVNRLLTDAITNAITNAVTIAIIDAQVATYHACKQHVFSDIQQC